MATWSPPRLVPVVVLLFALAACSAASAPPSPSAGGAGSPAASEETVDTPEEAAALVLAQDPLFAGFGPRDPDLIGQCCWYEVTPTASGYEVLVHAGWGDCPAGCINKHEWGFEVSRTGEVRLVAESGNAIPADGFGSDAPAG